MNIIYLVDLENICARPLYQYVEEHQDGEYIIFYSDNTSSPGSILEGLPDTIRVTFIDYKTGGNNAMDFCICAMAGRLSMSRIARLKVLSNDKGYDSMIHMLQEQGIRITREDVIYQPSLDKEKVQDENTPNHNDESDRRIIERIIQQNVPKKYRSELTGAILNAIDRNEAHEMCQAILPKNMAIQTYRKLRKYIPKEVV